MDHKTSIIYNALEFIAHHDQGDHGVDSFRTYARNAISAYWKESVKDGSADVMDIGSGR